MKPVHLICLLWPNHHLGLEFLLNCKALTMINCSYLEVLASALPVSGCLTGVLSILRTKASSARRRSWRLMLLRCRRKLKSCCRDVRRQKKRPRRQLLRWAHWLSAHFCPPEFTRAIAQRQGLLQPRWVPLIPHTIREVSWPCGFLVSQNTWANWLLSSNPQWQWEGV